MKPVYIVGSVIITIVVIFFYLLLFTNILVEHTKYAPAEINVQEQLEEENYLQQGNELNTPECIDTQVGNC